MSGSSTPRIGPCGLRPMRAVGARPAGGAYFSETGGVEKSVQDIMEGARRMPTRGKARGRKVAEQALPYSADIAKLSPAALSRKLEQMEAQIRQLHRVPRMRTTLYAEPPETQREAAFASAPLAQAENASAGKRERSKLIAAVQVSTLESVRRLEDLWPREQVFLMAACD